MTSALADFLARNDKYAQTHEPSLTIPEIMGSGRAPPKTCIVTCADPRVHPEAILDLQPFETVIFRTIAGHPQSVYTGMMTLDQEFGGFEDVFIIFHTDCGSTYFDEPKIRAAFADRAPEMEARVQQMELGGVHGSQEDAIRKDVEWLKAQPLVCEELKAGIKGFLYDIKTGKLKGVGS